MVLFLLIISKRPKMSLAIMEAHRRYAQCPCSNHIYLCTHIVITHITHTFLLLPDSYKLRQSPYVCDICQYRSRTPGALERHKQSVHDENRKFICKYCSRRYLSHKHLREHEFRTHERKVQQQSCKICEEFFLDLSTFNDHMKEHGPPSG